MKQCRYCFELLEDHESNCSNGHSAFRSPRQKTLDQFDTVTKLVRERHSEFSEEKLRSFALSAMSLANNANCEVTPEFLSDSKQVIETLFETKQHLKTENDRRRLEEEKRQRQVKEKQRLNKLAEVQAMLHRRSFPLSEDQILQMSSDIVSEAERKNVSINADYLTEIAMNLEAREAERQRQKVEQAEAKRRERERLEQERREDESRRWQLENERRERELQSYVERTDLERAVPEFRSRNENRMEREDLIPILADSINLAIYKHLPLTTSSAATTRTYQGSQGNQTFWKDAVGGQLRQGIHVQLIDFRITEWLPSSPGRYFTEAASRARERALRYIHDEREEYLPQGKAEMVYGGVGSVRLALREWAATEVYPVCATSNGISHQGIPILLQGEEYYRIVPFLLENGGCRANLAGRLKIIPPEKLPIRYERGIPKFIIAVNDLQILGPADELLVTVSVTFGLRRSPVDKRWSFCSFDPAHQSPRDAANWLQDYASRYSRNEPVQILSDFDEQEDYFEMPIEFPMSQVMNNNIDLSRLLSYKQDGRVEIYISGDYVGGDKNIYGDSISGNSVTINRGL